MTNMTIDICEKPAVTGNLITYRDCFAIVPLLVGFGQFLLNKK